MAGTVALRSLLFTPGNRPGMLAKAAASKADALVVDLEDGVPDDEKPHARETAAHFVRSNPDAIVFIRVNGTQTAWFAQDIAASVEAGAFGLMLPKVSSLDQLSRANALISDSERGCGRRQDSTELIPLIETVEGVLEAASILGRHQRCHRAAFGAYDFSADLGISLPRDRAGLLVPRALLALAARGRRQQPIDTVFASVRDIDGLIADATLARSLGFTGKMCIHPDQVEPINDVFSPGPEELARAHRIVAAFDDAIESGRAAVEVDGEMVDYPIARQARTLIEEAGEA